MKIPDVNVLVGAFHRGAVEHRVLRAWLERTVDAGEVIGLTPFVATGFVRVVTNPRVFEIPSSVAEAHGHVAQLLTEAGARLLPAGLRHWEIFSRLCLEVGARGNLASDAAIAASAIEHGATVVTLDRDFGRFDGLRWEAPGRLG